MGGGQHPPGRPPWWAVLLVVAFAVAAAASVAWAGHNGLLRSPDSGAYLGLAHNLEHGHGFTFPFVNITDRVPPAEVASHHGEFAPTQFPPLLSLAMASGSIVGLTGGQVSGLLSALSAAATVALAAVLVRRLGGGWAAAVVTAALVLVNTHLAFWRTAVVSEPPYLALLLVAALCLVEVAAPRGRDRPHPAALVGLIAVVLLGPLLRYIGLALVPVAFVTVVWSRALTARARWWLLAALAVAVLPALTWLAGWWSASPPGGSRVIAWHPLPLDGWRMLLHSLGSLLVPVDWLDQSTVLPVVAGAVVAVGVLAAGTTQAGTTGSVRSRRVVLGLLAAHLGVQVVTLFLLDTTSAFTGRLTSPVIVLAALLLGALLGDLWQPGEPSRGRRYRHPAARVASAAVLAASLVAQGTHWVDLQANQDHAQRRLEVSFASIADLAPGTLIFTNDPNTLWVLTGRHAATLPARYARMSGVPNQDFLRDLDQFQALARSRPVAVVYFTGRFDPEFATPRLLEATVGLREVARTADYVLLAGPAT